MAERDLARLLLEASRAVGAEAMADLSDRGWDDARPGHAAVFRHIDRRVGSRLVDLADRAGMTKQGMSLLVEELEERGYVRRIEDPDDARARIVRLTARGRRYAADARRATSAIEARVRRDLGDERYELLRSSLDDIVGGISGDDEIGGDAVVGEPLDDGA